MTTEQGTFDDVLDRLDFDFYDYDDEADLFQKLSGILDYGPSPLQMQQAQDRGRRHRMAAAERGFRVDRFFRRGQQITQMRDHRGRFIAQGAGAISDMLDEDYDLFA